jgi:hypothetical protein
VAGNGTPRTARKKFGLACHPAVVVSAWRRIASIHKLNSKSIMTLDRYIRLFAGTFVLTSLLLAHLHSTNWLWFTAFVGFNLLQSSLTRFCPLEIILKKLGVGKAGEGCCP